MRRSMTGWHVYGRTRTTEWRRLLVGFNLLCWTFACKKHGAVVHTLSNTLFAV